MNHTELTSREFNQDTARAKTAAEKGPVFITNRGKRTHVLLNIEDYERRQGTPATTLAEAFGMPAGYEDVELDLPERTIDTRRIPDFLAD